MAKKVDELVAQIKKLIDELAALSDRRTSSSGHVTSNKTVPSKKGAAGAISILIEEGFFDSPKRLQSIQEKLKEIGRYYERGLVSMNLLNLVKRRVLSRQKEGKNKNWQYVLRK